jgi:hypothetical protein
MWCRLVKFTDVSEEHLASIIKAWLISEGLFPTHICTTAPPLLLHYISVSRQRTFKTATITDSLQCGYCLGCRSWGYQKLSIWIIYTYRILACTIQMARNITTPKKPTRTWPRSNNRYRHAYFWLPSRPMVFASHHYADDRSTRLPTTHRTRKLLHMESR